MVEQYLHWMGFGLCHQLPERSFFGGGVQVPVCARDTGIYLGALVAFLLIAALHRGERRRGFAPLHVWIVMGVALLAMGVDGVSSYAGWRTTTNELRLITGLGVGFSVGAVVYPLLVEELWRRTDPTAILTPVRAFVIWLLAIPLTYAAVWWLAPMLGIVYPLLVSVSILFTLGVTNLVIVGLFPAFDRKAERLADLLVPSAIALALSIAEIAGAAALRVWVERL